MSYIIPLFDLNFDEKEEQAVLEVLKSKWISTGPKCQEFEQKFSGMLHVDHAVATANCTVSLHLALLLTGIKPGDEVICPSLTFVATVNAIRYVDANPVFADVKSPEDPTIDPEEIKRLITPRTKAIMVMHYGGFACDMDRIMDIAGQHNLKVIEDACHGPMAEYKGKKLGTIGDIGCFSFFSNKNISTGEGGMLVTNNEMYAKKARLLRSHGMTSLSYERSKGHSTEYDVVELGYNYRMDDIRAALGVVQLDKLLPDLEKRVQVRQWYIEALVDNPQIIIPFRDYPYFSSNYIFPIVLKDAGAEKRDEIRNKLAENGIQTSMHYPAVHRFSIYKNHYRELENTDYIVQSLITLPMFGRLLANQIKYISNSIKNTI
jgi:dTDP-4-amino-4,6-dideoxygalactose transaminase